MSDLRRGQTVFLRGEITAMAGEKVRVTFADANASIWLYERQIHKDFFVPGAMRDPMATAHPTEKTFPHRHAACLRLLDMAFPDSVLRTARAYMCGLFNFSYYIAADKEEAREQAMKYAGLVPERVKYAIFTQCMVRRVEKTYHDYCNENHVY